MIIPVALALLAAAQPAGIASEARCITDQFTPAERSELAELARRDADPPPPLQRRLEEIGAGCAESRGWNAENAPGIIGLAIATIIRDDTAPRLQQVGIAPAAVDAWLDRQSEQVRTTPAIAQADAERLVVDLHSGGVPMPTLEAHGELVGAYVGARVMIERAQRGLPLE